MGVKWDLKTARWEVGREGLGISRRYGATAGTQLSFLRRFGYILVIPSLENKAQIWVQ
jgi:hypothetical protein